MTSNQTLFTAYYAGFQRFLGGAQATPPQAPENPLELAMYNRAMAAASQEYVLARLPEGRDNLIARQYSRALGMINVEHGGLEVWVSDANVSADGVERDGAYQAERTSVFRSRADSGIYARHRLFDTNQDGIISSDPRGGAAGDNLRIAGGGDALDGAEGDWFRRRVTSFDYPSAYAFALPMSRVITAIQENRRPSPSEATVDLEATRDVLSSEHGGWNYHVGGYEAEYDGPTAIIARAQGPGSSLRRLGESVPASGIELAPQVAAVEPSPSVVAVSATFIEPEVSIPFSATNWAARGDRYTVAEGDSWRRIGQRIPAEVLAEVQRAVGGNVTPRELMNVIAAANGRSTDDMLMVMDPPIELRLPSLTELAARLSVRETAQAIGPATETTRTAPVVTPTTSSQLLIE